MEIGKGPIAGNIQANMTSRAIQNRNFRYVDGSDIQLLPSISKQINEILVAINNESRDRGTLVAAREGVKKVSDLDSESKLKGKGDKQEQELKEAKSRLKSEAEQSSTAQHGISATEKGDTAHRIKITYKSYYDFVDDTSQQHKNNEMQEKFLSDAVDLIERLLPEPYSIYTYKYFICNWPHLFYLAYAKVEKPTAMSGNENENERQAESEEEVCVGVIISRLEPHRHNNSISVRECVTAGGNDLSGNMGDDTSGGYHGNGAGFTINERHFLFHPDSNSSGRNMEATAMGMSMAGGISTASGDGHSYYLPKANTDPKRLMRGYIAMLAIDTTYRNLGIGSTLVKLTIAVLKVLGANEIVLETEQNNDLALRLYQKFGFIREKKLHKYYLDGQEAYRLKLWLPTELDLAEVE
ncbi:N-alpha-acetyltransferase 30 [Zancudomyces culisetae]|uniref:N-alpha-acetyltransferase 30 n=1 Tax=Zancudomyces culisetae TaxID=1213189 RepID=A0A1R1PFT1_ZANCU|nr:N-alpha-acetyltransferase 30 [Zancudomyces culisetae]|eukprot:OMH79773.1 N-alpha-acetyltransferase 30 [Zancudomyces culisetae]